MSYLLDKQRKQRRYAMIGGAVIVVGLLVYYRAHVSHGFSFLSHTVFRPVLTVGNNIGARFSSIGAYFSFKSSLTRDNAALRAELDEQAARLSNYNTVLNENATLKAELGRADSRSETVLSAILSKPNQSAYDTLIIDVGTNKNVKAGDMVYALGGVPIGKVDSAFLYSSKVVLFSTSGEKTQVVISGKLDAEGKAGDSTYMQAVGRGGGNFEMILPRDFMISKGDEVTLPGIIPHTIATVGDIISDPRDAFVKALLVSPVNVQAIKFVEVEIQK